MNIWREYNLFFLMGLLFLSGCGAPSFKSADTSYVPVIHVQQQPDKVWRKVLDAVAVAPNPVEVFTKDNADRLVVLKIEGKNIPTIFVTVGVLPSAGGTSADVYLFYREPTGGLQGEEEVKVAEKFQSNLLERLE